MSFGDRFLQSVMGNAVRIQNEISKVVKSDSNSSNSCTACRGTFNLLNNRKRQCTDCRDYFCPNCLIRLPTDRRLCNRCRIFGSNFSWDDLMQLKARDLKWFLDRRHIRTDGLKEKEQLADMIMFCFGSDRYYQDQARRQQRVAMMTSNLQDEFPMASGPVADQNSESPTNIRNSPSNDTRHSVSGEPQMPPPPYSSSAPTEPPHQSATDDPSVPPAAGDTPRQQTPNALPQSIPEDPPREPTANDSPHEPTANDPPRQSSSDDPLPQSAANDASDETPSTTARLRVEKVHLIDFKTSEEVEELSVRQLKVLLTSNHVDYRGCCEKTELIIKAKRLVTSHLDNVKKLAALSITEDGTAIAGAEDDLEDDMCKICMDALIDCVLLECGHMVTCLDCGKRMAECPICRQYVVRAVRIFKA